MQRVKNKNKYIEKNCASRWSFTKNHYSLYCLGYFRADSLFLTGLGETIGTSSLEKTKDYWRRLVLWHTDQCQVDILAPKVLWRCSNDYGETNPYCALRQHSFDIFISRTETPKPLVTIGHTDKSLAWPGRKQATATGDFDFHISYL